MGGQPLHQFVSPLRYPGGKRKLANFIKLIYLANGLVGSEYVEAYAGGASVALSLLFEEYASRIHINDINRPIATFWRVLLTNPDALCKRIRDSRPSMAEWRRQKAVQMHGDADDVDLAFSTFFLNRTARSGIINGGVVGGKAQDGPWRLDARLNRPELIRRIERISRFSGRITVTSLDAAEYLRRRLPTVPTPFVYLDPPYFMKGEGLYENFYQYQDHEEVSRLVRNLACPWVVSYDNRKEILKLYARFRSRTYSLSYSAADRYRGAEVMFFSRGLSIPKVVSPAGISAAGVQAVMLART